MKSQDIVILLKLVSLQDQEGHGAPGQFQAGREDLTSARGLESSLGISKTEVNASINRSIDSGLAVKDLWQVSPNRRDLHKFIVSGLKFVFPAKLGAMTRGVPTAFDAPVLEGPLMSAGEYIYVWPYALGKQMGQAIEPLFKSVPKAVQDDRQLYEYLALLDAIRLGKPRESRVAADRLEERLLKR